MTVDKQKSAHAWQPRPPQTDTDHAQMGRLMGNKAEQYLGGLESSNGGDLGEKMGIEFLEVSAKRVVAKMPVAGNTQPYGLLHGGASVLLAETVGTLGAMTHAGEGRIAVGVDINATHHRGVRAGFVTGTATALSLGNTVACYDIIVTDEDGNRVCTSRLTCVIRAQVPRP
jgi:1,4-dihydroxy-2-naphthoyl-CoA hydrolase